MTLGLEDIHNPRGAPRARVRCDVELRHRQLVWSGETEDVGPGGCQVRTPRVLDPGREVKLALRCPGLGRTLLASGRVAWMRAHAPARLGIAFDPGAPRDWFDALVRANPGALHAERAPRSLPRTAMLRLGRAPEAVVDFCAEELDVLRRVGGGVTLDVLARSFGDRLPDRARAAVFALLARRALVLEAGAAGAPEAWRALLARREGERPSRARASVTGGHSLSSVSGEGTSRPPEPSVAPGQPPPADPPFVATGPATVPAPAAAPRPARRTPDAQRLYDEALNYLGTGRLALALDRLRDAASCAPDDPLITSTAKRLARWT